MAESVWGPSAWGTIGHIGIAPAAYFGESCLYRSPSLQRGPGVGQTASAHVAVLVKSPCSSKAGRKRLLLLLTRSRCIANNAAMSNLPTLERLGCIYPRVAQWYIAKLRRTLTRQREFFQERHAWVDYMVSFLSTLDIARFKCCSKSAHSVTVPQHYPDDRLKACAVNWRGLLSGESMSIIALPRRAYDYTTHATFINTASEDDHYNPHRNGDVARKKRRIPRAHSARAFSAVPVPRRSRFTIATHDRCKFGCRR